MTRPYAFPEPIKTQARCKFSLPGRKYDCRRLGKYVLNGKGYCASHYDVTWKVQNPVYGQQHDWHRHVNKYSGVAYDYLTCRVCGSVKQYDGLPQEPCAGHMPTIRLWAAS